MLQKINIFFMFLCVHLTAEDYFIVFLVNARHLDHSNFQCLLKTIAKHPSDGSKNGDVGHAWIYLKGNEVIEGGHTGEFGTWQPRYMEGVMDNIALGAKNPISYLWAPQCDGCFQKGNGGHMPTFAAKVMLTEKQYLEIRAFISTYYFQDYCITDRQCCTFVTEVAKIIGLKIEDQAILRINPYLKIGRSHYRLWVDPSYEYLNYGSPDRLELSLKELVSTGAAEDVLKWYQKNNRECLNSRFKKFLKTMWNFPARFLRYFSIG